MANISILEDNVICQRSWTLLHTFLKYIIILVNFFTAYARG